MSQHRPETRGDLVDLALQGDFDVIVHGCDCFHAMTSALGRRVRDALPEAYIADCATAKGDRGKLGRYSWARIERTDVSFAVCNAYTHFEADGSGGRLDYRAVSASLAAICRAFPDARIGYPRLDAGLPGGDWLLLRILVERAFRGARATLVLPPEEHVSC